MATANTNKNFEFTTSSLKVRDKIIKRLSSIDLITYQSQVEGTLKFSSKEFNYSSNMIGFEMILDSIYQFEKIPNEWAFKFNNVKVEFSLSL